MNRMRLLSAALAMGMFAVPARIPAQPVRPDHSLHFQPGVAVSYFPAYAYEDSRTRQWGVSFLGLLTGGSGNGLEFGYTYVPQSETTGSSAPRLHAFRLMVVGSSQQSVDFPVRITGGLGGAVLRLKPQSINCGDFPLCAEWAPQEGTRQAIAGSLGIALNLLGPLTASADARAYRLVGGESWRPDGDPNWLSEVSLGVRYRF